MRVAHFLRRHPPGDRLCLGYSGGLDSTVLLHLLAGLQGEVGYRLSAIHVHHGLSSQAEVWVGHCQRQCVRLAVPLQVERVVVNLAGQGLEAAAREARYQMFSRLDVDALALAHHRDDQAETVLLQLLRGAGMKGLAAMPATRPLGSISLLRPLLDVSRGEMEAYAQTHQLSWVDDESNADTSLSRNAVRHQLMPVLQSLFPNAAVTLAQAAAQFAEVAGLLDTLAREDGAADDLSAGIAVARLAALDAARARNLLSHYLEQNGIAIHRARLHETLAQMLAARADAQPSIDFGGATLRRFQGRVLLVKKTLPAGAQSWSWQGEATLDLGVAGQLCFASTPGGGVRLPGQARVSLRAGGEKLRPDVRRPARTLKNLLREAGLPPWVRERLPLVYVEGRLAWAAELGADVMFQAGPDEVGWLISWHKPE